MKLRHIAEEMRIEKTGIKWGKMMTRYLPAPPNLMHQNCRNPVYKHASISVYQRTRISVPTNKQDKQKNADLRNVFRYKAWSANQFGN